MTNRRQFLQFAGAALTVPAFPSAGVAQAWPTRTIRAMIPFAAGSSLDIVGRLVLDPLSSQLGQPVVVENRGGAGGTIGTGLVAKAKAGSVTYASAGVGSATHWAAERIRMAGGFTGIHVPFRGGPEALTEVMTGRVDFTSMGMSAALPLIRDGKLVALAVSTPTRSKTLPDVPTTIEAGLPDSDYVYWMGLFAPAKTPPAIVERLRAETEKALKHPNVVEKFAAQGIEPMPLSPAAFDALIRKEIETNIALVKAAGLKFN